MRSLRNTSGSLPASIEIREDSPDWKAAYELWLSGKNPSGDPAWKEGVYFTGLPVPLHVSGHVVESGVFYALTSDGEKFAVFSCTTAQEEASFVDGWVGWLLRRTSDGKNLRVERMKK